MVLGFSGRDAVAAPLWLVFLGLGVACLLKARALLRNRSLHAAPRWAGAAVLGILGAGWTFVGAYGVVVALLP